MVDDHATTIQNLKDLLSEFRDLRDWGKFHDPKNLAEAISVEASELLELFLWKTPEEIGAALNSDPMFRRAAESELADVICFCLNLANAVHVDVAKIVMSKVEENKRKYPVDKAKGKSTKYDKL